MDPDKWRTRPSQEENLWKVHGRGFEVHFANVDCWVPLHQLFQDAGRTQVSPGHGKPLPAVSEVFRSPVKYC